MSHHLRSRAPTKTHLHWLARWFKGHRTTARPRHRLTLERCESRVAPAIATLSSGVLTIDFTATGATAESVTVSNDGTNIVLTGKVTGATSNAVSSVNSVQVFASGGSSNQSLSFEGATTYVLSDGLTISGIENLVINRAINAMGSGGISIDVRKSISVNADIVTESGALSLLANQSGPYSKGDFVGIDVNTASIQSTTGDIMVRGRGGDWSSGPNTGVLLHNGAGIIGGATGSVTVQGIGGQNTFGNCHGVSLIGANSRVTSTGAAISIAGTAGGSGLYGEFGVSIDGAAFVSAGGSASISLTGTGVSSENEEGAGVFVGDNSKVISAAGSISINGTGTGIPGIGIPNLIGVTGVQLLGLVSAAGTGDVTVTGNADRADRYNTGVWLDGPNARITTNDGNISVTGTCGLIGYFDNQGIQLSSGSQISSGGAGTVHLVGKGGSNHLERSYGVYVSGLDSGITSGIGTVSIYGTGKSRGVYLASDTQITSAGDITITGTPAILTSAGSLIASTGTGNVLIGSNGTLSGDITSNGNITLTAGITLTGRFLAPSGTLLANVPGGTVTIYSSGNQAAQIVIPTNVTVWVHGSFNSTGFVQVDGTLGGKGSVGVVTVSSTGRLVPGDDSPGKFTTGNIALNVGSTFQIQQTSFSDSQLVVNGTVNLGGASLQLPSVHRGRVLRIIDNLGSGAVTGTLTPLGLADYLVRYDDGTGNDVTVTPPVTVSSVVFGDGTNQRSMVKQMIINFSQPVNFTPDAFTLFRHGTGGPMDTVSLVVNPVVGPTSAVTIAFSSLTEFGSLIDGYYDLTIDAAKVSSANGNLDGDADGTFGGNRVIIGNGSNRLFRFFGDSNGDTSVTMTDFAAMRAAFNLPSSTFDFDGDGIANLFDYARFRARYGLSP